VPKKNGFFFVPARWWSPNFKAAGVAQQRRVQNMAAAVDKAYQTIRDGIVRGKFAPGAHLTAQDLGEASGLSRTPVREAMRRLHAEGLIEFIPHRGAFVTRVDEQEITNIYELRVALESYAAAKAARNVTSEELKRLSTLATRMRNLVELNSSSLAEDLSELNNEFHKLIVIATHNVRLQSALASIVEMPLVLRTFRRYQLSELVRSTNQHIELVSALSEHDSEWARCVMTSHILSAQHTLLRSVKAEVGSPQMEND
jgi:DNA-binding GntR family transcriptional regulator